MKQQATTLVIFVVLFWLPSFGATAWAGDNGYIQLGVSYRYLRCPAGMTSPVGYISVRNTGSEDLQWQAIARTTGDLDWLRVSPDSGILAPYSQVTVTTWMEGGTLSAGRYAGTLIFQGNAPNKPEVQIDAEVVRDNRSSIWPTDISLDANAGEKATGTTRLTNLGPDPLPFRAVVAASDQAWLSVSPASGMLGNNLYVDDFTSLAISADASMLSTGSYRAVITVTAPNLRATSPSANINVYLQVKQPAVWDDLSLFEVAPVAGTPLIQQTALNFQAKASYTLRTQSAAKLILRLQDQNGQKILDSDPVTINKSTTSQTLQLQLPPANTVLKLATNVNQVTLKALLLDPASGSVVKQSAAINYPVGGNRIRSVELGRVTLMPGPLVYSYDFLPYPASTVWVAGLNFISQNPMNVPKGLRVTTDVFSPLGATLKIIQLEFDRHGNLHKSTKLRKVAQLEPEENQTELFILPSVMEVSRETMKLAWGAILEPNGGEPVLAPPLEINVDNLVVTATPVPLGFLPSQENEFNFAIERNIFSSRDYTCLLTLSRGDNLYLTKSFEFRNNPSSGATPFLFMDQIPINTGLLSAHAYIGGGGASYKELIWSIPPGEKRASMTIQPRDTAVILDLMQTFIVKNELSRSASYRWTPRPLKQIVGPQAHETQGLKAAGAPGSNALATVQSGSQLASLDDFLGLAATWSFDPPIPANGSFIADIQLSYDPSSLPVDPNFDESKLEIVSYDPTTGGCWRYDTVLDRTNHTAAARVDGLAAYYSLGVFGPFANRSLNLPIFSSATELAIRIAVVNLAPTTAISTNTVYSGAGEPLAATNAINPAVFSLASQQCQISPAEADFGLGDNVGDGWIQTQVNQPAFFAWEQIENDADLDMLVVDDSVAFTSVLTEVAYDTNYPARVHLINPSFFDTRVDLALCDQDGQLMAEAVQFLAAKGKLNATLVDLFTNVPPQFTGYLIVDGNQEIMGAVVLSKTASLSVLKAQALASRPAGTILALPGFALGKEQYVARLMLVNPTTNAIALVLRARNTAGADFAAPAPITLAPRQQRQVDLASTFGLRTGDGTVLSCQIEGQTSHLLGHVTFSFGSSTNAPNCARPLDIGAATDWVFGRVANDAGWFTELSLFNPGGASAPVEISAFSTNGVVIGVQQVVVPAQGTIAQSLRDLIPASDGLAAGYFTVLSYQPIVATAMMGKTNRLGLSTLMGQPTGLPGLRPKLRAQLVPNQTILYWSAAAVDYVLESTPSLTKPATWTPVSSSSSLLGDDRVVTDPRSASKFYRLRKY